MLIRRILLRRQLTMKMVVGLKKMKKTYTII